MGAVTALQSITEALEAHGCTVRRAGARIKAQCPVHADHEPSLSVGYTNGRVLVKCHAGCHTGDILTALGLRWEDLFDNPRRAPALAGQLVREHVYVNGSGTIVGSVLRLEPKTFRPLNAQDWSVAATELLKSTPYRLSELVAAIAQRRVIYVTEGEKDADMLYALGEVATCNAGGAEKWTADHAYWLKDSDVIIVRDNDPAGRKHAEKVVVTLAGVATSLRVMRPATGKDVSDHLAAGLSLSDLVDETAEYRAPYRRVISQPVALIGLKRRQWLWEYRIPLGELTLWAGHAGIGKSVRTVTE